MDANIARERATHPKPTVLSDFILGSQDGIVNVLGIILGLSAATRDRKSTRLNSSHVAISYAVFCLKKKLHAPGYGGARAGALFGGEVGSAQGVDVSPVEEWA